MDPVQAFVGHALVELVAAGVSVQLENSRRLIHADGAACNGYFEDHEEGVPPTFAVAVGKPIEHWLHVFVHEYMHFCQWRDAGRKWLEEWMDGPQEPMNTVMEWIEGKRPLTVEEAHRLSLLGYECERDCEARTAATILEWGLPIDRAMYIRKANSYLTFYHRLAHLKCWYDTAPYEIEEIMDAMPADRILNRDEHAQLALETADLFERCKPPEDSKT